MGFGIEKAIPENYGFDKKNFLRILYTSVAVGVGPFWALEMFVVVPRQSTLTGKLFILTLPLAAAILATLLLAWIEVKLLTMFLSWSAKNSMAALKKLTETEGFQPIDVKVRRKNILETVLFQMSGYRGRTAVSADGKVHSVSCFHPEPGEFSGRMYPLYRRSYYVMTRMPLVIPNEESEDLELRKAS